MWEIYSIGDAAYLTQVFNSVAMIFGSDNIETLAMIGFLMGTIFAVVKGIMSGGREIDFSSIVVGLVIYMCLFVPKTSVTIESVYTGSVRTVDNVPLGPASIGSMISQIGHGITNLMETGFAYPTMNSYGFADSLNTLAKVRKEAAAEAFLAQIKGNNNMTGTLKNYINDCTMVGIDLEQLSASNIRKQDDLVSAIRFDSDIYTTGVYQDETNEALRTCSEAWNDIQVIVANGGPLETNIFNALKGPLANDNEQRQNSGTIDPEAQLNNIATNIVGAGAHAQRMALNSVLETVMEVAEEQHYYDNMMAMKAAEISTVNRTRNAAWQLEQDAFAQVALPLMTFFEALIFAIAPFMVFLLGLGKMGINLVGKYIQIGLWVQLWMPMLAIVNLYLNMVFFGSMESFAVNGGAAFPSLDALNRMDSELQTWLGVGGKLVASVPAIAMLLLYGGSQAATHMARAFDASATAATTASGMSAPTAMRNGPAIAMASGMNANYGGGIMRSGTEGFQSNYSMSELTGSSVSSSRAWANSATSGLGSSVFSQIQGAQSNSAEGKLANTIKDSWGTDFSQTQSWADEKAQQIVESNGLDKSHTQAVSEAIQRSAQAGGNVSIGLGDLFSVGGGGTIKTAHEAKGMSQDQIKSGVARDIKDLFKEGSGSKAEFDQAYGTDVANSQSVTDQIKATKTDGGQLQKNLQTQQSATTAYNTASNYQAAFEGKTSLKAHEIGQAIAANGGNATLAQLVSRYGAGQDVERAQQNLLGTGGFVSEDQAYAAAAVGVLMGQYGNNLEGGAQVSARNDALGVVSGAFGLNSPKLGNADGNKHIIADAPGDSMVRDLEGRTGELPDQGQLNATGANAVIGAGNLPGSRGAVEERHAQEKSEVASRFSENKSANRAGADAAREELTAQRQQLAESSLASGAAIASRLVGDDILSTPSTSADQAAVEDYLQTVNSGNINPGNVARPDELGRVADSTNMTPAQEQLLFLESQAAGGTRGAQKFSDHEERLAVAREAVIQEAGGGDQGRQVATIVAAMGDRYGNLETGNPETDVTSQPVGQQELSEYNRFWELENERGGRQP